MIQLVPASDTSLAFLVQKQIYWISRPRLFSINEVESKFLKMTNVTRTKCAKLFCCVIFQSRLSTFAELLPNRTCCADCYTVYNGSNYWFSVSANQQHCQLDLDNLKTLLHLVCMFHATNPFLQRQCPWLGTRHSSEGDANFVFSVIGVLQVCNIRSMFNVFFKQIINTFTMQRHYEGHANG
jgi:hypothetical protein